MLCFLLLVQLSSAWICFVEVAYYVRTYPLMQQDRPCFAFDRLQRLTSSVVHRGMSSNPTRQELLHDDVERYVQT